MPDLATFGKGMANGLPLAAVVGPRELMREFEDIFVSSTFGGDTLALAACRATLDDYRASPSIEHLWRMGRRFQEGFGALPRGSACPRGCIGYPVHPKVVIDHPSPEAQRLLMSLFLQETAGARRIVHFAGFNISFSHGEADVDETLDACAAALRAVGEALADGRDRRAPPRQALSGAVSALVSPCVVAFIIERKNYYRAFATAGRRRAQARLHGRVLARLGSARAGAKCPGEGEAVGRRPLARPGQGRRRQGLGVSRLGAALPMGQARVLIYHGKPELLQRLAESPPDAVFAAWPRRQTSRRSPAG